MPEIQGGELGLLGRHIFGIRGAEIWSTISPELVGVVIARDLTAQPYRSGVAGTFIAGGGAGLRSEIHIVNSRGAPLSRVRIKRVFASSSTGAATAIELLTGVNTSGFSDSQVRYADHRLGIAPINIGTKNTAAASAGGSLLATIQLGLGSTYAEIPVDAIIRALASPFGGTNEFMVRPTADNTAIALYAEWVEEDELP